MRRVGVEERRAAKTLPAVPPPIIIMSKVSSSFATNMME